MALSFATLASAYNNADQTSYTIASHTVTISRPVVIFVHIVQVSATPPSATLSGNGTTWTEIADIATTNRREMAFLGIPPAGATGTVTITMVDEGTGTTAIGCGWSVVDCTNAVTSGTIVQVVELDTASGTTFAITLASPAAASHRTLGFARKSDANSITKGANFTLLDSDAGASPNTALLSQYSTSAFETTCNWAHGTSAGAWGGIALEISDSAPAGTADPYPYLGGGYYPTEG